MADHPPPNPATSDLAPASPGRLALAWIRLKPIVRQTWLNLKVWVPFLQNPADRARLATFLAREKRNGLEWQIRLPDQCWSCGRTDQLREREYEIPVRSFEYPLPIAGLGGLCVGFFLLLALAFGSLKMFVLALVSVVITVAVTWVKSWSETVCVSMSTCPDHAREMRVPHCVVDQGELYLFLPNARLATATIAVAKAERLKRQGYVPIESGAPMSTAGAGGRPAETPGDEYDDDRPRYRPPPPRKPVELPPLKLDGGDEE